MLDTSPSSTASTTPAGRHSYLTHHNHDQTLDSIRNAIASDSQRIRVQDESTGQSYELQLGKEVAYPETFQRHSPQQQQQPLQDHDANGVRDTVKSVASSNGSALARAGGRFGLGHGGTASADAGTPPDTSNAAGPSSSSSASSSAAHKVLRLPLIVRHRNNAGPNASSSNNEKASESSASGDVQLKELNRRYHESLKADGASSGSLKRHTSRDSTTRNSRDSAAPSAASPSPSQYTAPARHYPIMSELPPSPPLESDADMHAQKGILAAAPQGPRPAPANGPNEHRRPQRQGSNSTVYMSADDGDGDGDGDEDSHDIDTADTIQAASKHAAGAAPDDDDDDGDADTPTTPTAPRQPFTALRGSPDHMSHDAAATPTAAPALKSSQSTTTSSSGLLHPASAHTPGAPSSPSKRGKSAPPRGPPPRRNTTGSSTGSVDSFGGNNARPGSSGSTWGSAIRRGSRDRWMPNGIARRDSMSNVEGSGKAAAGVIPSSATPGAAAGPLKTGDAGFDEEIAKHEALIRKRKERARREEEEKALAAAQQQEAENQEEDKPRGSAMPALMRAKSGLGKVGGVAGMPGGGAVTAAHHQPAQEHHDEDKAAAAALKGNIINENHANYVLMYNMLTGIRIGVSRCQAKMKRPLQDEDYQAKHKFTFDIIGNELTPSAKYDFKFKDYAPWVFRELREYFHLDPADYLLSLTAKYILSELGSPGKSGSFFYFSRDYRFIIKTIRHSEHKFLRRILKDYHEHVKANPHTLLSRFYGLHRVKLPHGRKIHFVIMNNLFPPHRDIHETYDLKGSSLGREYPEEKAKTKKGATLKDINWIRRRRELELGPQKRALFEAQLQSDVALLKRLNIMDYSLLIGLHDLKRGNSEGLRQEKLQVVQPENSGGQSSNSGNASSGGGGGGAMAVSAVTSGGPVVTTPPAVEHEGGASLTSSPSKRSPLPRIQIPQEHNGESSGSRPAVTRAGSTGTLGVRSDDEFVDAEAGWSPTAATSPVPGPSLQQQQQQQQALSPTQHAHKRASEKDAFALRAAVRRSDAKALGSSSGAQLPARETSEKRHFLFYQDEAGFRSTGPNDEPGDWIYYLGVIDLFTPYSSVKRGENWWKSLSGDSRMISAVPPKQYGTRFVQFLTAIVRPLKWSELPPGFDKIEPMEGIEEIHGGPAGGKRGKGRQGGKK